MTKTFTLYRSSSFGHLTGKDWVEVLTASIEACEARAEQLRAKGFKTKIA